MAFLSITRGKSAGASFLVFRSHEPTVIGRDPQADVRIDDERASRRHARIRLVRGSWRIEDLGSRNGTRVGSRKVERAVLEDGAVIRIGGTELRFDSGGYPPPPQEEICGCRPLETEREGSGVLVCRAFQAALDREVRLDFLVRPGSLDASAFEFLEKGLEASRREKAPPIEPLVSVHKTREDGAPVAVFKTPGGRTLRQAAAAVSTLSLSGRARLARSLCELFLRRIAVPLLRVPLLLEHVRLVEGDGGLQPVAAAFDLGAACAALRGDLVHLDASAPFLPPEVTERARPPFDPPVLLYNAGAIVKYVLGAGVGSGPASRSRAAATGRPEAALPLAVLVPGCPQSVSDLIEAFLREDPALRPANAEEALGELKGALDPLARGLSKTVPAPTAPAGELQRGGPGPHKADARFSPSAGSPGGGFATALLRLPLWLLLWALLFGASWWLARTLTLELSK